MTVLTETTIVDDAIAQTLQAEQAAKQAVEDEIQAELSRLRQRIYEALGDFEPVFQPYMCTGEYKVFNHKPLTIQLSIPYEPVDLLLAPFEAVARTGKNSILFSPRFSSKVYNVGDLGALLAERRNAFPEWQKARIDKLAKPLRDLLVYYYGIGNRRIETVEAADLVLKELIEIDPEQKEHWEELHRTWLEQHKAHQARQAEQEKAEVDLKLYLERYKSEYRAWLLEYNRVLEANREKFNELQTMFNDPYQVYKLFYAVMGEDAEGYRELEEKWVYVSASQPDPDGFWPVLDQGRAAAIRYMNPIKVEGPLTVRPADEDHSYARKLWIGEAGQYLWYRPGDLVDEAVERAGFSHLPVEPECKLSNERKRAVQHSVREKVFDEMTEVLTHSDVSITQIHFDQVQGIGE